MNYEELKVGDAVIIDGGRHGNERLVKVERLTKTQIIAHGSKFSRKNGSLIGGGTWCTTMLREATPEAKDRILRVRLIDAIRACDFGHVTTGTLNTIYGLIK